MANLLRSFNGAFSFGTANRSSNKMNTTFSQFESPSPQKYDVKPIKSLSAHKFGTAQRFHQKQEGPAVGDYDLIFADKRKLKLTFKGKKLNDMNSEKSHLGPGSYNIMPKNEGRKSGFGDRFMQTHESDVPAPNEYQIQMKTVTSFNKKEGSTFSYTKQNSIYPRSITPGPGYYNYQSENLSQSKCQTIGRGTREAYYHKDSTPGPDQYLVGKSDPKGFTFGSKYQKVGEELTPGPGSYEICREKKQKVQKFSTCKKGNVFDGKELIPGPGSYLGLIDRNDGKGLKFSTAERIRTDKYQTPGPGQYDSEQNSFSEQGGVILKREKIRKQEQSPGPGDYYYENEKSVEVTRKDKLFGGSKRFKEIIQHNVGPNQYLIKQPIGVGYSFSRAKSTRAKLERPKYVSPPGIGEYDISGEIGYIPKYLIKEQKNIENL